MSALKSCTCHIALILSYLWNLTTCEQLLHSVSDEVPGGNFTFYQVKAKGRLRLQLTSDMGDGDLYVSTETLRPDYYNYQMKSTTCGEDSVEIPSSLHRPVGVGVYGHPRYSYEEDLIKYTLAVYFISESDDMDYARLDAMYNSFSDDGSENSQDQTPGASPNSHVPAEEEEESTLWHILITILKVLFEILL